MEENNEKEEKKEKKKNLRKKIIIGIIIAAAAVFIFCVIRQLVVKYVYQYDKSETIEYREGQSCAMYIYMCGSNLESKQGLAGQDIDELLGADIPENMNIVIQTGGAKNWLSHDIANDKLQRYVIKDKKLTLVDELDNASMGSVETFTDFLNWSAKEYPAERSMLVMWDHGSSSADAVCYDENYSNDALEYSELQSAFESAREGKKYDFVLFDACYMGSIEIASLIKDYSHYMVASQKIIPGGGMDYTTIVNSFSIFLVMLLML